MVVVGQDRYCCTMKRGLRDALMTAHHRLCCLTHNGLLLSKDVAFVYQTFTCI
jgi:hypothetical protein